MADDRIPQAADVWEPAIEETFVAFVDVLGFGRLIEDDFESAVAKYQEFLQRLGGFAGIHPEVSLQVYSDSLSITSRNLVAIAQAIQNVNFMALTADCLVRGGIGFGRHASRVEGDDTFVVSQALTRAAHVEKTVGHPCVAFHESVELEDWVWLNGADTFVRPILYFDGLRIINPFSLFWGRSAQFRVSEMRQQYPEHRGKYDWFLRLFDAVLARDIRVLVPPEFADAFEMSVPQVEADAESPNA